MPPEFDKNKFMFFVKKFLDPSKSANHSEKMAIFGHFGHFEADFGTQLADFSPNSADFFQT